MRGDDVRAGRTEVESALVARGALMTALLRALAVDMALEGRVDVYKQGMILIKVWVMLEKEVPRPMTAWRSFAGGGASASHDP